MSFQYTNGIDRHSLASRVKAAENNKYLIRVTNTGITQLINNKGQIIKSIKPLKDNILIADIFYK
jgi:apolipoprotein N-acyltransferase